MKANFGKCFLLRSLLICLLSSCGLWPLVALPEGLKVSTVYKTHSKETQIDLQHVAIGKHSQVLFVAKYLSDGIYALGGFGSLSLLPPSAKSTPPQEATEPYLSEPRGKYAPVPFEDITTLETGQVFVMANRGSALKEILPDRVQALNAENQAYATFPTRPGETTRPPLFEAPYFSPGATMRISKGPNETVYILNQTYQSIWIQKSGVAKSFFATPLKYVTHPSTYIGDLLSLLQVKNSIGNSIIEDYAPLEVSVDGRNTAIAMEDIAVDSKGIVYVSDAKNHEIYRISPPNQISRFAGNGTSGFKDGKGTEALFNQPKDLAINNKDTLFVADQGNHRIRQISQDGTVTTLAGTGTEESPDGPTAMANPYSLDVDNAQEDLYVLSQAQGWQYVRKIEVPANLW